MEVHPQMIVESSNMLEHILASLNRTECAHRDDKVVKLGCFDACCDKKTEA
jgi:hypothetical protein